MQISCFASCLRSPLRYLTVRGFTARTRSDSPRLPRPVIMQSRWFITAGNETDVRLDDVFRLFTPTAITPAESRLRFSVVN